MRSVTEVLNPPLVVEQPHGIAAPPPTGGHGHDGGHAEHGPTGILKWLTSTDHKVIGMSYMITSLVMFYLAGIMALLIRIQLTAPHSTLLSFNQYNELFTMHGSLKL